MALATFISTTNGSLSEEVKHGPSPPNSVALLSHGNLLCSSKLSLPGGSGHAFSVSNGDSGHYLRGAFFVLRLRLRGFVLLLKEVQTSLQTLVDLTLIRQLVKGLSQLLEFSSHVPILLVELIVFPRIVGFWR